MAEEQKKPESEYLEQVLNLKRRLRLTGAGENLLEEPATDETYEELRRNRRSTGLTDALYEQRIAPSEFEKPAPHEKLTLALPDYVKEFLRTEANRRNTTIKAIILEMVQATYPDKIEIRKVDMEDQRGIFMKRVAQQLRG